MCPVSHDRDPLNPLTTKSREPVIDWDDVTSIVRGLFKYATVRCVQPGQLEAVKSIYGFVPVEDYPEGFEPLNGEIGMAPGGPGNLGLRFISIGDS
jgi:hypothetical protein